jgi:phage shock protein C
MNGSRRLYRSADDRIIAGVAAGVADYLDVDPILIRVLWLISIPISGFLTGVAYLIMMVAVPLEPPQWQQPGAWQPGGAPVGGAAPGTPPGQPAAGTAPQDPATAGQPQGPATAGQPAPGQAQPAGPAYGWDARWQRRAERWERRAERWERRGNSGGLVFGALLIVVGGLFAWHEIDPRLDLGLLWPVAVIAVGIVLIATSVGFRRGS